MMMLFENDIERMEKLKEWGLITPKSKTIKTFKYKGNSIPTECIIMGFTNKPINTNVSPLDETIAIIVNSKVIKISVKCLKQMQLNSFKLSTMPQLKLGQF
jgi:hypothetical protein